VATKTATLLVLALVMLLASASSARAQTTPAVEEVQIHGQKTPKAGQTVLAAEEIRQVPGTFGDHFRVVETLPGVTPIVSGLPFFFVRGAPPGNNGYYLDGVRVPVLFHVGFGPSVVHPGLVKRVDFYPGGYPARFGRFAGGILSAETRAPASELHGEGNLRLFDAGVLVESPFADGRGTALVAGRYSYTAPVLSLIAPEARLAYWDYQSRVTWSLGKDDTIGAFVFGSHDFLGEVREKDDKERTIFATQFHRIDLRWDHRLPGGGAMRVASTIGLDETATDLVQGVRDRMLGVRLTIDQPVSKGVVVRGGLDSVIDHYDLAEREYSQVPSSLYPPRNDLASGAFLDAVLRPHPRWEVTPGLRTDLFASALEETPRPYPTAIAPRRATAGSTNSAKVAVDPRLLSRLALHDKVTLVSTFGVVHQPPAFFVPIPGLQIGRLGKGLQTGAQMSQGLEVALPYAFSATPTVFYNHTLGLTDYIATCTSDADIGDLTRDEDCIDRRVRGGTVGLELMLRRSLTQRLTGWLSYTLSRTTRTVRRSGVSDVIPGDFDRTHVLNVIGAYDLGRNWRLGARFYFYTGRPYSRTYHDFAVPPFNSERMPAFHRFDVRLEKGWRVGKSGHIAFVVEVLNTTLRKEVVNMDCSSRSAPTEQDLRRAIRRGIPASQLDTCTPDQIGPITIPSIGVEGSF
jgi:hypothetical protein